MKKIIFLVTITLILGSAAAFAAEAGKMPYNGITVFEESPGSSPASESSKSFYNGVTVFRTGPGAFDNAGFVNGLAQFSDCPLPMTQLSKAGANSTTTCDNIIGSCI